VPQFNGWFYTHSPTYADSATFQFSMIGQTAVLLIGTLYDSATFNGSVSDYSSAPPIGRRMVKDLKSTPIRAT